MKMNEVKLFRKKIVSMKIIEHGNEGKTTEELK